MKEESTTSVVPVTHSSGNHGQALALAANLHNLKAQVIVPDISPQSKKDAISSYGADIHESESSAEVLVHFLLNKASLYRNYSFKKCYVQKM